MGDIVAARNGLAAVVLLTVISMTMAACGTSPSPGATSGTGGAQTTGAGGSGGTALPPGGTPTAEPAADTITYGGTFPGRSGFAPLTVGGESRRVYIHLPASLSARPPLVIAFHGTGANESDDAVEAALGELGAREAADAAGFVLIAPISTNDGGTNADHEEGGPGWRFGGDASSNPDLALVRAMIQEARRAFQIDATHVYVVGFSNGAFFSYFAAMKLGDRVAAFAESSGGLIACGNRVDCAHAAAGASSCASILAQAPGVCTCPIGAAPFPTARASGRVPAGFLKHNADDSTVSSVFTCRLAEHLGARATVSVDPTGEHGPTNDFLIKAWAFMATRSLAD